MRTIEVDWPGSHDAGDDECFVMQMLEAGGDEGPLIVLPLQLRQVRPPLSSGRPEVFKDASHYIAHLSVHEDELRGERWVGLVRGAERENGAGALAALLHLRRAVTPPPRKRPGSSFRPPEPVLDYATFSDDPGFAGSLRIVHVGEFADEVLKAFPTMPKGMIEVGLDG